MYSPPLLINEDGVKWCRNEDICVDLCAAVTVGLRRPGGDGAAEEGAHRGSEGDQEAAGETAAFVAVAARRSTETREYFLFACVHT